MEGRGVMTTAPISLQDLRRRLYVKAKAEKDWRFWGLYVQVGKLETLRAAYDVAKQNDGAPGIDGVTFEAIEDTGVEAFLAQLRDELVSRTYLATAEPEGRDSERRRADPRPWDSGDSGPRGTRGAPPHPTTDL